MGWVGVSTLLTVACYILYRYLPYSRESQHSPHRRPSIQFSSTESTVGEDRPSQRLPEAVTSQNDDNNLTDEFQATPKASAATSDMSTASIPSIQLDGGGEVIVELPEPRQTGRSIRQSSNVANESAMSSSHDPQPSSSSLMPPPPLPRSRSLVAGQHSLSSFSGASAIERKYPPRLGNGALCPPPSTASLLRGPQTNRRPSNTQPLNTAARPSGRRPALSPGYSPLDWAAFTSDLKHNLRGTNLPPALIKVTPSMLKSQNGRKGSDAWTSYQGKVYNITPYLPYHPGGRGELLRGAGKDSMKLFFETHPWVNWDAILGECLVGVLVSENDSLHDANALDAMD